jgi:sarcosine oxidase
MRAVVVGAGAWGLPAALALADRGHQVTCVDRDGPGNPWASSGGPTRLWRLADPDPAAIRLARRAAAALDRIEARLGRQVHTWTGLLWRDAPGPLRTIADAVRAEGVPHTEVPAASVGEVFPGLVADDRDALWFPDAGATLAADLVAGYTRLLGEAGGTMVTGAEVLSVRTTAGGAAVLLGDDTTLEADVVVVCAGPGTPALLGDIGLAVPLMPFLEQVVHLGTPGDPHAADGMPCLFDGPGEHGPGIYTMPTPGVGYKVGIDDPLRVLTPGDRGRDPDPDRTRAIVARADAVLPVAGREVVDELVCCWTDSPDGWFVVDRVGSVVVACGDAGKGFKYSPAMGEILADLAEGGTAEPDVAAMSAARLAGRVVDQDWVPTALGHAT